MSISIEEEPLKKKNFKKEILFAIVFLVGVLAFRSSCYEPFRIPSGSMIPTLMVGDFILVDKLSYGLKLPFSGSNIAGMNFNPWYLMRWNEPERGDVIVFKFPKDTSVNFIKRVVAVPGDSVEIKEKRLYINGVEIPLTEVLGNKFKGKLSGKYRDFNLKFFRSRMTAATHFIQYDQDNFYRSDFEKRVVPKNHYFVLGDNRDFSHDSRFWGMVPKKNIKGKATRVWFSMELPEHHSRKSQLSIRFDRIGHQIQ